MHILVMTVRLEMDDVQVIRAIQSAGERMRYDCFRIKMDMVVEPPQNQHSEWFQSRPLNGVRFQSRPLNGNSIQRPGLEPF